MAARAAGDVAGVRARSRAGAGVYSLPRAVQAPAAAELGDTGYEVVAVVALQPWPPFQTNLSGCAALLATPARMVTLVPHHPSRSSAHPGSESG
eukprot:21759-Prymnesium_polylepis.1